MTMTLRSRTTSLTLEARSLIATSDTYYIRDAFTSGDATDPRTCVPGPGELAITDTAGGSVTVAGGTMTVTGSGTYGQTVVTGEAITRRNGLRFEVDITSPLNSTFFVGLQTTADPQSSPTPLVDVVLYALKFDNTEKIDVIVNSTEVVSDVASWAAATTYRVRFALKTYGCTMSISGGAFGALGTAWTELYDTSAGINIGLYPVINSRFAVAVVHDNFNCYLPEDAEAYREFIVTSPDDYQIFQRDGSDEADIYIAGFYDGFTPTVIQARWGTVDDWATIDAAPAGGSFSGYLTNKSAGQERLYVRPANDTSLTYIVEYVGIGDIYVIAGQSNASGRGPDQGDAAPANGLRGGLFGNDYTWKRLSDKVDDTTGQVDAVSQDVGGAAGCCWIAVAEEVMDDQTVPVAMVPCAMAATSIAAWQPGVDHSDRTTLYGSMNYRITEVGGAKAVLWQQGENDALSGMAEATYNAYLDTLADAVNADQGIKLMACKIHNISDRNETNVNNAIGTAWGDNANVLEGPDFSAYVADGDLHFSSQADIDHQASEWWAAIEAEFYP
jgi:hypothetical protein